MMSEDSPTWRGDLLRRMAAIHAEMARLANAELPGSQRVKMAKELEQQLGDLSEKLLAS